MYNYDLMSENTNQRLEEATTIFYEKQVEFNIAKEELEKAEKEYYKIISIAQIEMRD